MHARPISPRRLLVGRTSWRDRLLAADPGLNRLRIASHGALAVATAIGAERLFRLGTGPASASLVAMLLGAVVAMQATIGLSSASGPAETLRISAGFPVAMALGLTAGTVVADHGPLPLAVFVVVQFAAVFVRRYGPPFFVYGFMGWMGYFFSSFLRATPAELPSLLEDVGVAVAVVVALSLTVLRNRPDRVVARLLDAFVARSRAVAEAAASILEAVATAPAEADDDGPKATAGERRLHRRMVAMTEAALMVDAAFADLGAVPAGWSAEGVRRWLLDAQLTVEQLVAGALRLAAACGRRSPADCALAEGAARLLLAVAAGDAAGVRNRARALDRQGRQGREGASSLAGAMACRLAAAGAEHTETLAHGPVSAGPAPLRWRPSGAGRVGFEPAVQLMMGALPGSAAVAGQVAAPTGSRNPLRRMSLVARQATQAALSGALAIAAGYFVSSRRYYWAVIATFVVFAGTATRAETLLKGGQRIIGTLVGIAVSLVIADATFGNTPAVLAVIVASMFLALYTQRLSYTLMVLFITVMLGELYSVLDLLSGGLLVLRLEETAVGAAIAVAVAAAFLPVSTTAAAGVARSAFFEALEALIERCGELLAGDRGGPASAEDAARAPGEGGDELDRLARRLDLRYQQLDQVMRPRMRSALFGADPEGVRQRLGRYLLSTSAARELVVAVREDGPPRPALARASARLSAACGLLAAHDRHKAASMGLAELLDGATTELGEAARVTAAVPVAPEQGTDVREQAVARLLVAVRALAGLDPADTPAVAALAPVQMGRGEEPSSRPRPEAS